VGVRRATTDAERADAFEVRRAVFIEEQGVPREIEYDGRDEEAIHFVAYPDDYGGSEADDEDAASDDAEPVGAARLRERDDTTAKVERVAVRADARGEGWGRRLMDALEATAAGRGVETLVLHSQTHVEGFYLQLGYETTSDVFEEAGIPHVEMEKSLR
jgi:predicted GNAT family N-acyltransferase